MTVYTTTTNLKTTQESVFPIVQLATTVQIRSAAKNVQPTVKHVLEVTMTSAVLANLVTISMKKRETAFPAAQMDFTWIIIKLSAVNAVKTVRHALNFKPAQNADMA
ncbi:UNVERIFIED_CONTAM: hypothetical protein K2H54_047269 [Gekko kuhli]